MGTPTETDAFAASEKTDLHIGFHQLAEDGEQDRYREAVDE